MSELYLKPIQLNAELEKCLQCKTNPCTKACPALCSPRNFISYAKDGNWKNAAEDILKHNPLAEVCGLVCPDKFCVKACLRAKIDHAIKIPEVQAAIMKKARTLSDLQCETSPKNGKKIAIIGFGPSGMGAAAEALKYGYFVEIFEKDDEAGGALNLIPKDRLPKEALAADWKRLANHPHLKINFSIRITDYSKLLMQGFSAVIVCVGEQKIRKLDVEGEEFIVDYAEYLKYPSNYKSGGHVMIIGGGAAAVDCALTAVRQGATHTEMLVRRGISHMRITVAERHNLLQAHVDITTMTRLLKVEKNGELLRVHTIRTQFDEQGKLVDESEGTIVRDGVNIIISALGAQRGEDLIENPNIFYAGDFVNGGSTAVEAVASGKAAVRSFVAAD